MKTLTIFRHAKSSWDDPELDDHDRPLNKRGMRDAPIMAKRLKVSGIRPSLILSSTAVRAWETAKLIASEINYPPEFLQRERALYHAGVAGIIDVIAAQDNGFNSLLLVGHNPGLTEFANRLIPRLTDNIPTSGFVAFSLGIDDWNVAKPKSVDLIEYDFPKRHR